MYAFLLQKCNKPIKIIGNSVIFLIDMRISVLRLHLSRYLTAFFRIFQCPAFAIYIKGADKPMPFGKNSAVGTLRVDN